MKQLFVIALALALTGCATKNYGRMGELTGYENNTLTCREIDLETAKVQGFLAHIDKESEFDARSVLSFLGDFGIGNLMERSSAEESANQRLAQLQNLRARKNCVYADSTIGTGTPAKANSSPDITAPIAKAPSTVAQAQSGQYSHEAAQLAESLACGNGPVLSAKDPRFEIYTASCSGGGALTIRCELGANCRAFR